MGSSGRISDEELGELLDAIEDASLDVKNDHDVQASLDKCFYELTNIAETRQRS